MGNVESLIKNYLEDFYNNADLEVKVFVYEFELKVFYYIPLKRDFKFASYVGEDFGDYFLKETRIICDEENKSGLVFGFDVLDILGYVSKN